MNESQKTISSTLEELAADLGISEVDFGGKLKITGEATGSRGIVRLSKGLASRIAAYAGQLTDEKSGTLTRAAETVVAKRPLEPTTDVVAPRESFKNLTGRRIAFYDPSDPQPKMVVFYMGIPDTTPELLDRERLEQYFEIQFKRLGQTK